MKPKINLMVDSGAYSAWSLGKSIDLPEYIAFLRDRQREITAQINLDVIGPQDPEVAAAAGWKNFDIIRNAGLDVVPVYHARENMKWLGKMMDETDYIFLSGTSLVSPLEHRFWYNLCWQYGTDAKGRALARFHALGDTDQMSLNTYPWYSVDSATWMIQSGRAARVQLQGKSYQLRSSHIGDSSFISDDDPLPKKEAWQQEFRALGVDPEILMKVKCTRSQMAMIRGYINAVGLLKLRDKTAHVTTYKARPTLLEHKRAQTGGHKREGAAKIYFVLSPSAWYYNYPVLTLAKVDHVLVSYFYVKGAPAKYWEERLLPFLYDPEDFCERHPKLRVNIDKIREVLDRSGVPV